MQLNLEHPDHQFLLRGADGSQARVNDRLLASSFIVAPDRLLEDWPVTDARTLVAGDLQALLDLDPEVILLGTGHTQVFPSAAVMAACLVDGSLTASRSPSPPTSHHLTCSRRGVRISRSTGRRISTSNAVTS